MDIRHVFHTKQQPHQPHTHTRTEQGCGNHAARPCKNLLLLGGITFRASPRPPPETPSLSSTAGSHLQNSHVYGGATFEQCTFQSYAVQQRTCPAVPRAWSVRASRDTFRRIRTSTPSRWRHTVHMPATATAAAAGDTSLLMCVCCQR